MTKLRYKMENGEMVNTYAEALMRGEKFSRVYEPYNPNDFKVNPEMRARRLAAIQKGGVKNAN